MTVIAGADGGSILFLKGLATALFLIIAAVIAFLMAMPPDAKERLLRKKPKAEERAEP